MTVRAGSRVAIGAALPVREVHGMCEAAFGSRACRQVAPPFALLVRVRMADEGARFRGGWRGVVECAALAVFLGAWFGSRRGSSLGGSDAESEGAVWAALSCGALLGGLFLGGFILRGELSLRIEVHWGGRQTTTSTQTPRDPRITKRGNRGDYESESSSSPRSSDSSEVDRRLLGFPWWHRHVCVNRAEYERVRARAEVDGRGVWDVHRVEVGCLSTTRSPWSRRCVEHCETIEVYEAEWAIDQYRERRAQEREELLRVAMECYPGHYVGDEDE